jgi:hypothetical protein
MAERYDPPVAGRSEQRTPWRRLVPWYDALLLSGLGLAVLTWTLDRTADLELSTWLSVLCLITLTLALRPITQRWVA